MYARSVRSLMSISRGGFASRSFIIGSRLCPPAMMRASSCALSEAIAPSRLVARSYSNGAGVCIFVLDRGVGADDRRTAGPVARVEAARGEAAGARVAQRRPARAGDRDRRLAAEAGERERALRVDLADARRLHRGAVGEVAQAVGLRAGVEALDQAHRVRQA